MGITTDALVAIPKRGKALHSGKLTNQAMHHIEFGIGVGDMGNRDYWKNPVPSISVFDLGANEISN